ncbi:MAG: hypothetical protein WC685_13265 [Methylobacter sp.]|jgi:hypothetical protein
MMISHLKNGHYRKTTALEKLFTSLVNVVVVFVASIPFFLFDGLSALTLKLIIIGLFFLENVMAIIFLDFGESLFLRKLFWASLPNKQQKTHDR